MADSLTLPIVWMIDESSRELRTYASLLKSALPSDSLEVKAMEPYKSLQEYLPLLANPQTACIITDQRLKVTGIATYTGIELADFIRGINGKLPVYILTNFADDKDEFIGLEWSVEDIVAKEDLVQPEGPKTIAARIIRRVDTYKDILDERSKRMQELISKSSRELLNDSEVEELETLGLQKSSPMLAAELTQVRQLEQLIQAHESLMRRYREHVSGSESEEGTGGE